MKNLKIFLAILFVVLASCSKDDDSPVQPDTTPAQTNVYLAGTTTNNNGIKVPTIWKNGIATNLVSNPVEDTYLRKIIVTGNDVYAFGSENAGNSSNIVIWKNNIKTTINNASSNDFSVDNGNVYVFGSQRDSNGTFIRKYWKNGIETILTTSGGARLKKMIVVNSDVYICGSEQIGTKKVATFWKNGIPTNISDLTKDATAINMQVQNNEISVVYKEDNTTTPASKFDIKLWKNNQVSVIISDNFSVTDYEIVLFNNNDIFTLSFSSENSISKIRNFKNSTENTVTNGANFSFSTSMIVDNNDVYIGGYENINATSSSTKIAKIWKNGQATTLSDGISNEQVLKLFFFENKIYAIGTNTNSFWIDNVRKPLQPIANSDLTDIVVVKQ